MKKLFLLKALIICYSFQLFSQKTPQHVEPPFWWSGMVHNELQIMVHEPGISTANVRIEQPGIIVNQVVSDQNPNYLFIYLDISEAPPCTFKIEFLDGKKVKYVYKYELRKRVENSKNRVSFDASDAIYLLMPDRFSNGDVTNDNMPGALELADRSNPDGRHGGDIKGIINHLDYIKELGFTAIWITPLLENNQPRYSYHGYAITDFYKIDPRFGSNEDYRQLVQIAQNKGLKIIQDMVFNHCGHKHWWLNDLPTSDWLNQWHEFTRTSYRMEPIVDPHSAKTDYNIMVKGWFDINMPDLNQNNHFLSTYLIQNSIWWIEYAGIQGIRIDTQPFAERKFISDWGQHIAEEYPYFRTVGEAWMGIPAMVGYYQGGKSNHDGYNSNIPSLFDFPLYDAIREAFNEKPGWNEGLLRLYNMLSLDFLYADPYNLVVFPDNHDVSRISGTISKDVDKLKLLLTFVFTTRGIPMMYYGTELLMDGNDHEGHGKIRLPFPGGWNDDKINAFATSGRTEDQNKIVNHIRTLLGFRKANAALHYGNLKQFIPHDNVYVYFRYDDNSTIMVVLNSNDEPRVLNTKRFAEATNGFETGMELFSEQVFEIGEDWILPAKTSMVLKLK